MRHTRTSTLGRLAIAIGLLTSCSTVIGIEDLTLYEGGLNGGGQGGTNATGDASVGMSGAGGAQNGQSGSGQSGNGQSGNGQSGSPQTEGGSTDTGSDVVITPEAACIEMAETQCANFASCPYVMTVLYGTLDVCLTRAKLNCMSMLTAPGSGHTPALLHQCASQGRGQGCAQFNPPASCAPAGTLADSKPCWTPSQCAGGACSTRVGETCGVCAKLSPLGGPCFSPYDCNNSFDMACIGASQANSGNCMAGGLKNATCSVDGTRPCRMDLWCDKGLCADAPHLKADQACDPLQQGCDIYQGLTCDAVQQKCTPLMVGQIGQPCPGYICAASGTCKDPGTPGNICQAAAIDGAACDDIGGVAVRCMYPSLCVSKVCTLPNDRCKQ